MPSVPVFPEVGPDRKEMSVKHMPQFLSDIRKFIKYVSGKFASIWSFLVHIMNAPDMESQPD